MRPTVKSDGYPFFEPNQILSADNLNHTFDYLDEQERLTRANLVGIGIVCGLKLNPGADSIVVTKGLGVTSEGYLIVEPEDLKLVAYKEYKLPDEPAYSTFVNNATSTQYPLWELLTEQKTNTTPLSGAQDFLKNKAVLLFLELRKEGLRNCTPSSCDDNGTEVSALVRPLLVNREDLDAIIKASESASKNSGLSSSELAETYKARLDLTDIRLPRYNVPATNMVATGQILMPFVNAVIELLQNTGAVLTAAYEAFYPAVSDLYPSDPFDAFSKQSEEFKKAIDSAKPPVALQYFYDFASDIVQAYDELRWKGLELLCACNPPEELFPRHLLLGLLVPASVTNPEAYRQPFLASPATSPCAKLREDFRLLFQRLVEIIKCFSLEGMDDIRITPSSYGKFPLSEKAIPGYYSEEGQLQLYHLWNPIKTRTNRANENLSYNCDKYKEVPPAFIVNPLKYDLEPYNFLRVEGHLNKDYREVMKNLITLKKTNRLPIEIIALRTGRFDENVRLDLSKDRCEFRDLVTLYKTLRKELLDNLCEGLIILYNIPFENAKSSGRSLQPLLKEYAPSFTYKAGTVGSWYETILDDVEILDKFDLRTEQIEVRQKRLSQLKAFFTTHGLPSELSGVGVLIYFVTRFAEVFPDDIFSLSSSDMEKRYRYIADIVAYSLMLESGSNPAGFETFVSGRYFSAKLEPIKALYNEYIRRLTEEKRKQYFSHFVKNNPGIQHGAGVPMGGTFIVVYHGKSDGTTPAPTLTAAAAITRLETISEYTVPVYTPKWQMAAAAPLYTMTTLATETEAPAPVEATKAPLAQPELLPLKVKTAAARTTMPEASPTVAPKKNRQTRYLAQKAGREYSLRVDAQKTGRAAAALSAETFEPSHLSVKPATSASAYIQNIDAVTSQQAGGYASEPVDFTATLNAEGTFITKESSLNKADILELKHLAVENPKLAEIIGKITDLIDIPKEKISTFPDIFDFVEEGIVVADFFLPYICCSDCTPVQYVLPKPNIDLTMEIACTGPDGAKVVVTSKTGVQPLSYKLDGEAYADVTEPLLLLPGTHTIMIRDNDGSESVEKSITIPDMLSIGAEEFIEDLKNDTYQVKFTVSGGTPPYKAETGAETAADVKSTLADKNQAAISQLDTSSRTATLKTDMSRTRKTLSGRNLTYIGSSLAKTALETVSTGGVIIDNVFLSERVKYGTPISVTIFDSIGCRVSKSFESPANYTLLTTANPAEGGSVIRKPEADTYSPGTQVTLKAQANAGYVFNSWAGDASSTTDTIYVTMDSEKKVDANFKPAAHTLTYAAEKGGTIKGNSPQTVEHGGGGEKVIALPDTGYSFVKWSDGKTTYSRTDTNVTGDASYTAIFERLSYTLTYKAGEGGTISGVSPQTVASGGSGTAVTARPNFGYRFVNWSDGNTSPSRTDTNVTSNGEFTAVFEQTFILTATASPPGTGAITLKPGGGTYSAGTQVALTATATEGWKFAYWEGPVADKESPQTAIVMNANQRVTAVFTQISSITATPTLRTRVAGTTTPIQPAEPTPLESIRPLPRRIIR